MRLFGSEGPAVRPVSPQPSRTPCALPPGRAAACCNGTNEFYIVFVYCLKLVALFEGDQRGGGWRATVSTHQVGIAKVYEILGSF